MSFLRYDNLLGSSCAGRNLAFLTGQQWRNRTSRFSLVAQRVPVGIGSSESLGWTITGKMDPPRGDANRRHHHLHRLDDSLAINRKQP